MMESVLLVDRLKQAIQDDFKGMREEIEKINQENKQLTENNDSLTKLNKELKEDNVRLTKTLKELKDKYDHLLGKLKRKQDEIKKKEQWWDKYRFTAETMIKKLRTEGSFSLEVLHEVSRDLVDIMEETSNKESSSSHSSQDNDVKSISKLTTSKDRKKRVRYTEVSPENTGSDLKGRAQTKESRTQTINMETGNVEDESGRKKQSDLGPAAADRIQMPEGRKMGTEKNKKLRLGSKKQVTEDRKGGERKEQDGWNDLGATDATKKGSEKHGMYDDDDDDGACGYPLLTSTPMFSSSNAKSLLSGIASHDISIIPKDKENVRHPREVDDSSVANHDGDNHSSPLTPAVPAIFENLLTRRTSLTSNNSCTYKNKKKEEKFPLKDETTVHLKKDKKLHGSKDMKIGKMSTADKDNPSSPSILRNAEFGTGAAAVDDNTIDYPVAGDDNLGSPSILALDLKPAGEEKCEDLNGIKRKRGSSEEKMGMKLADQEEEVLTQPYKKLSRRKNSTKSTFKTPSTPHNTLTHANKPAPITPQSCSILLLSDEEGNKMDSSSIDMFADPEKSVPKDSSNDKDVFEGQGQPSKPAIPSASQLSKDHDPVIKQIDVDEDLLNEEFPGFSKPDELNYKNIQVVRKKGERAKLNGFSCRDCEQYFGEMTEEERKKRLKHCSRHRAKYSPPPSTPPGFWNLSFPSTQEVIEAGMMVTGDEVPVKKPLRRPRKKRLSKPIPKQNM